MTTTRTDRRPSPATSQESGTAGFVVEGRTVRLRTIRTADLATIERWWEEPEANWLDGGEHEGPAFQFREGFVHRIRQRREPSWFVVERKGTDTEMALPAGYVIYRTYPDDATGAEVSLRLSRRFWGQRLGTEAFGLFIDHLFFVRGFDHLWLTVYIFNPRAIRLYEKAGFVGEDTYLDEKGLELIKMVLSRADHERAHPEGRPRCES